MATPTKIVIAEERGGQWGAATYVLDEEEFATCESVFKTNVESDALALAEITAGDIGALHVEKAPSTD